MATSFTATVESSVGASLNSGEFTAIADACKKAKLGTALSTIKVVATGLTAAASFDITSAAFLAKCTVTGINLGGGETLPAIGAATSLRVVTGGTNAAGSYALGEAAGTAVLATAGVGTALLSADGKTVTFAAGAAVTALTLIYRPRTAVPMTTFLSQAGV